MFGDVKSLEFGFRRDAEDAEFFQREKDARARAERPGGRRASAEELHAEEFESAAVEDAREFIAVAACGRRGEEADGDRAPHAVHAVDRHRADGVVDVDLVEREHGEDHEHAGDEADDDGGVRRHEVARRGDRHEPRERAVESHRQVRLAHDDPCRDERGDGSGACGEVRGHRDASDRADARRVAAGVEPEPANPQEEHAKRAKDEAVARNRVRLAVVAVLADAGPQRNRAREGDPAAYGVDDRGAGEVVEAKLLKPALRRRASKAAPHPVSAHGIDEARDDDRVDEVALELDALGDRA